MAVEKPMNIRVRGPGGALTLSGISGSCTVHDFQQQVAAKSNVSPECQTFKSGFPPKPLPITDAQMPVTAWGLRNGDSLVLESKGGSAPAAAPQQPAAHASAPATDAQSMRTPQLAQTGNSTASINGASLLDGRRVVRRIVDSDNSCLFNAMGYNLERSRSTQRKMRQVVAKAVAADPFEFNEGMLGRDNAEYQQWIQKEETWGGPVELFILAKHYKTEIAAYDIRTQRCDTYGKGEGYSQQCFLVYDGLHYDAMALQAFADAPEEVDCTQIGTDDPDLQQVAKAAEQLVKALHESKSFTDTANFTLRCGVCNTGLQGEKEAVEHAKSTGHQNFQEY